jgi:hypothetical protein
LHHIRGESTVHCLFKCGTDATVVFVETAGGTAVPWAHGKNLKMLYGRPFTRWHCRAGKSEQRLQRLTPIVLRAVRAAAQT